MANLRFELVSAPARFGRLDGCVVGCGAGLGLGEFDCIHIPELHGERP